MSHRPLSPEQLATLLPDIARRAHDLITVLEPDGTIVYMNDACRTLLGFEPEEFVGQHVTEFTHPDEVARVTLWLTMLEAASRQPGTTLVRFRLPDGRPVPLEINVSAVSDGARTLYLTVGRRPVVRYILEDVMQRVLEGQSVERVMARLTDCVDWRLHGSRIAFWWHDPDGRERWLAPDLPAALSGLESPGSGPWHQAVATRTPVHDLSLDRLDDATRLQARRAGLGAYWVEPILGIHHPAAVTVWTRRDGSSPVLHAEGMQLAARLARLVLVSAERTGHA